MYAIIQSGGRQVRVEPGSIVSVDHRSEQAGDEIAFDRVLFVVKDDTFRTGSPFVAGARVTGVVDGEVQGPKIRVLRKKRRKGMCRTTGHRTRMTQVRITNIETG